MSKLVASIKSNIHIYNQSIKQELNITINKKNIARIKADGKLISEHKLSSNYIKEIVIGLRND